jgi:peptide/nickel transport system permease protein
MTAVWRRPGGRVGLVLVLLVCGFAVAGPGLIPFGADAFDIRDRFAAPSWRHWAGTDALGRDMLARLAEGGRVALAVSVLTVGIALPLGALLGVLAARGGRVAGALVLAGFDIVAAFPSVLFALAAAALFGPGLRNVVLLVAITLAPGFGRVARAQTLSLSGAAFLDAARMAGAGPARLWLHHILPNIAGPLVVLAGMDIPTVITLEAGLSFLGLGIPPPAASWGGLLYDGYLHLQQSVWPVLGAATMLVLATLGFTLLGEAVREALDPEADA